MTTKVKQFIEIAGKLALFVFKKSCWILLHYCIVFKQVIFDWLQANQSAASTEREANKDNNAQLPVGEEVSPSLVQVMEALGSDMPPILTVSLELVDNSVTFTPPLDETSSRDSVSEVIRQWLADYLARGRLVQMISGKVRGESLLHRNKIQFKQAIGHCCSMLFLV